MSKKNSKAKDEQASAENFVRAWQAGISLDEVARGLGCTKQAASNRAVVFRRQGVILKKCPRGHRGPRLNYPALVALAKKEAPKS